MFTGIIQHVGSVVSSSATVAGRRLRVDVGPLAAGLAHGASVAVDGACLTVAVLSGALADFDVVPETLARTTLGRLRPGSEVNLEPALAANGRLDGHLVQGHVDGLAELLGIERQGAEYRLRLGADRQLTDEMVAKGSVALAGVSLTLVDVQPERFAVALIPTTLEKTTLRRLRPGDRLNVELDVVGKYVRRQLQNMLGQGGLTLEKLRQAGLAP